MTIPKYTDQLPIPADLQPAAVACPQDPGGCDDYTITMAQTTQQMLPANIATPYPTTNIFAYSATPVGGGTYAAAPGGTIKATRGRTVRVNWVNSLTTFDHPFMPVDPTLDWANPNNFVVPVGSFLLFPPGYPQAQTPVPAAPSLHGGEVSSVSAGGSNQWFTSNNITGAGLTPGTNYTAPNIANFVYPNGQQASTLWYHDNAEGVSRLNQYSGLQGFYEISDPADTTIAPLLPSGAQDIPLAIQDAQFNVDGTLAFPLGGLNPQIHPYWMGEFYGDVIVVNGKVWPNLNVDPREYRFRILNSSQNRTMLLNLNNGQAFTQIASDGGYLPNPVQTTSLSLGPGERAEILVDFSGQAAGTQIILENTGLAGLLAPNPDTNGQVMRFTVSGATPVPPAGNLPFTLNNMPALTSDSPTRTMTLHDAVSAQTGATLGFYINGQPMSAATDILPAVGSTETWEVINTGLTPISLHLPLVQARLLNRELYDSISYLTAWELANGVDPLLGLQGPLPGATVPVPVAPYLLPPVEAPLPEELGWKDTISIFPLEVTRIQVRYAPQDAVGAAPNVNLFPFNPTVGPGYWLQSSWPSAADNQMSRPMQLNDTAPILSMTKTVVNTTNPGLDAAPGDTLTYTITVRNDGGGLATANNVVVTDAGPNDTNAPTPAGPYLLGNIAGGGASVQQIYTVTVNGTLALSTQTINNTATATADNHLPVTASASIGTAQVPPVLGLAKSVSDANGDLIAQNGELLTYTLTVTNTGPGPATGVTITDGGPNNSSAPSPAGPYVIGTVIAGGNAVRTYTVTVDASVPGTVAAINNSATLTATNHVAVNATATIRNASSDLSPLSPLAIPKYVDQLVKPPAWTPTTIEADGTEVYDISMERFQQQILPTQFPATTVFGYSGTAGGPFQNSPSGTFEATRGTPIRVNWTNNLQSQFLPVDPTIHWADPLNLGMVMPPFEAWPPGYPEAQDIVPAVTHLHGGEVQSDDDGGPNSWITGTDILGPGVVAANHTATNTLTSNYPNSQEGTTLWYHDHAMGATRINVMSGLAGFYLLRDPADSIAASLPSGDYELPIAIQDRQFNTDGTFSYPLGGPNPAIHPYWVPEFLGDTIMVNGKTWPNKNVEPHQYRLRLLNGSNARFYTLGFSNGMSFTQIGTDGGYLPHPIASTFLTIAPGERADLLVDFSGVPAGTQIILTNTAPAPFPLGALPDPNTTGQIMRFTVNAVAPVTPPSLPFNLATIPALTPDSPTRTLTLNEALNLTTGAPVGVFLNGQPFNGAITETPVMGSTEEWDIVNLTADAHPIHLHLVQFQIMNRELINSFAYAFNWDVANGNDPSMGLMAPLDHPTVTIPVTPYLIPNPTPPMVNEQGWKDTIQVPPGMVTRIKVRFAPQDAVGATPGVNPYTFDPTFGPGYVWHCHILEHEDNEMMRPMSITAGPPPTVTPNNLGYQPGNWTNDTTPAVSAAISGLPAGQNIIAGTVTFDMGTASEYVCSGGEVTLSNTLVGCTPTTALSGGAHTVDYTAEFSPGIPGAGTQTINVDLTDPTVSNILPSGSIGSTSTTISASYSDGGSGIDALTAAIHMDGSPTALTGCTITFAGISCPKSGLTEGLHNFEITVNDNTGNTGSGSGSFSVDSLAPAVTSLSPSGLVTSTSPTISASYSDSGFGINSATAVITLDASALAGCTATGTGISCPTSGLSQGVHNYTVSVNDNVGNTGSSSGSFTVDTVAPVVSGLQASSIGTTATLSANLADGGSGINATSANVFVDGSLTALTGCDKTASAVSCQFTTTPGDHAFTANVLDNAGNLSASVTPVAFTINDYPVIGAIKIKWDSLSGAPGPAISAEYAVMSGSVWLGQAQDFSNGMIFWRPSGGSYWIHGDILVKYNALGGATGIMGVPLSDNYDISAGSGANFANGRIYWSLNTGAHAVNGAILTKLLSDGGVARDGFPMTDEYDVGGIAGARASDFQSAKIYWSATTGAHTVFGGIMVRYDEMGGPGAIGLPVTDEYNIPGIINGRESDFERGRIYYHPLLGVTGVRGGILVKYLEAGGPAGFLGMPIAAEMDVAGVAGAREADFERGRIYWSPTTGSHSINGGIFVTYIGYGGPTSALGLPITDEYSIAIPGARRSRFEHGFITFVPGVGVWVDIV